MGGSGYRPTNAAAGVYEEQLRALQQGRSAFAQLQADLDAFNKQYGGRLPAITDKLPAAGSQ